MFKWSIVIALLCALAQGEVNPKKTNFTRTKELNITRGVTFPFGSDVATASKYNTHVQINIFKGDSVEPSVQCAIPLNSMKNSIVGRLNAATSDNEVVIWGETSTDDVGEDKRIRFEGVRVNPSLGENCKPTPMVFPSYQVPKKFFTPLKPVVLSSKEGFSILHHQQQDCPPCQFKEKDDSFVSTHGDTEGKPSKNFLIKIVRLPSGEDGYFYAYNYDNNTAVVRYLKIDGTIVNEKYVDHPVDAADPVKDKSLVNVCLEKDTHEVHCGQLDEKLEFRFKERLPLLEGHIVMSLTVSSGPKGELLAGTVQTDSGKPQKYVVYRYDVDGKLIETLDFGELDENHVGDVYSWYSGVSGLYCLRAHETETLGDLDAREVIRCIELK